jgi:hypothetical protein
MMTKMKKLVAVVLMGAATLAIAAQSRAAGGSSGGISPTPTVSPSPTIVLSPNVCPAGWRLVQGTKTASGAFTCQPIKMTKMVQCPNGTEYYDDGCLVGCQIPPK